MILVTGATGFIGSHVVERLCASGAPVRAVVRRPNSSLPCETARCDLATGSGLESALQGIAAVIHLAGATKALVADDYHRANVLATANLARALEHREVRLVHVSSLAAAGPSPDGTPLNEDAPPRPVSQYGRSKLEGERAAREFKPDAVIIRPPVVYGPRDTGVFRLLKSISRGWTLEIGGGERWLSAVFVDDLVDGLIRAAAPEVPAGRTYFMAHPKAMTWTSLASTAARIMSLQTRTVRVPPRAAYGVGYCAEIWSWLTRRPGVVSRDKIGEAQYRFWVCDSQRAATELGWQASTSLEDGLAQTLQWYKGAGWIRF